MRDQIKIDKKSKILIFFLFFLLLISSSISYYKFIILKDFIIFMNEEDIPNPLIQFKTNE